MLSDPDREGLGGSVSTDGRGQDAQGTGQPLHHWVLGPLSPWGGLRSPGNILGWPMTLVSYGCDLQGRYRHSQSLGSLHPLGRWEQIVHRDLSESQLLGGAKTTERCPQAGSGKDSPMSCLPSGAREVPCNGPCKVLMSEFSAFLPQMRSIQTAWKDISQKD